MADRPDLHLTWLKGVFKGDHNEDSVWAQKHTTAEVTCSSRSNVQQGSERGGSLQTGYAIDIAQPVKQQHGANGKFESLTQRLIAELHTSEWPNHFHIVRPSTDKQAPLSKSRN